MKEQGGCLTEFQQAKLYNYVQDHIQEQIIPSDLSLLLDYSHHYFARLFKNSFQLSAREWIVRQKIRNAASELLSTDKSIARIAESLGFSDAYFFSRQFKKVMKDSPTRYRERNRFYS
jgi:AraC family transcriptional regulator of arabinose operon